MLGSKRFCWSALALIIISLMDMVEVEGQNDNGILGRSRTPQWAPNFPGGGGNEFDGRSELEDENEIPFEEEQPYVEPTTRRYPYPEEDYTPRNEVPLSPTSTPAEVTTIPIIPNYTEEKQPWYSRLGHFAKKKWHQLKNKFSG